MTNEASTEAQASRTHPHTTGDADAHGVAEVASRATAAQRAMREASPAERAGWLRAVADHLDAAQDELIDIAHAETTLPTARLAGELARTTGQLRLFADVALDGDWLGVTIDRAQPDSTPPRPDMRRTVVSLGPVAVYAAGNFPFAFSVAGGDTASALAAGCPVIVKAHPGHPRTSDATAEAVTAALASSGAPAGAFSLIHGFDAGRWLAMAPEIRAVAFTGSKAGGRALFDLAVSRPDPIPFFGELGSLNPVVLTRQAVAARGADIARGLVESFTLGVGQFCTKPGVVLVPSGTEFVSLVTAAVRDVGPGSMLSTSGAAAFQSAVSAATASSVVEVVAGEPDRAVNQRSAAPVVATTNVDGFLANADLLSEECFGPYTLLVTYEDLSEVEAVLEAIGGSLTSALHAQPEEFGELSELWRVMAEHAGRVLFDGWPTGVAVTWSTHHGGPWPATTSPLHTSVGATAIHRFLRPVLHQNAPSELLPPAVHPDNPWGVPRRIDGRFEQRDGVGAQ